MGYFMTSESLHSSSVAPLAGSMLQVVSLISPLSISMNQSCRWRNLFAGRKGVRFSTSLWVLRLSFYFCMAESVSIRLVWRVSVSSVQGDTSYPLVTAFHSGKPQPLHGAFPDSVLIPSFSTEFACLYFCRMLWDISFFFNLGLFRDFSKESPLIYL